jgi:hypothetical protein
MPGFSPFQIAKAYRDEHPGKFDAFDDAQLIKAIELEDPETYQLIDPLLYGAELLAPVKAPKPPAWHPPQRALRTGGIPKPGEAFPLPRPDFPAPTGFDQAAMAALRIVPAIAGTIGGAVVGGAGGSGVPVLGTTIGAVGGSRVGGAAGSGLGETAAQTYANWTGLSDSGLNPSTIAFETALGAVNPAPAASWGRRIAQGAGYGTMLGAGGTVGRSLIETGELPSMGDLAFNTAMGLGLGTGMSGAVEGAGAASSRLRSAASTDFGLPTDVAPPGPGGRLQHAVTADVLGEIDRARQADVISREFVKRGWTIPEGASLQHGIEAKQYLQELQALGEPYVPIPPMDPSLVPPEPPLQLPEFVPGDPRPPNMDLVGQTPPYPHVPVLSADPIERITDELNRGLRAGTGEGPPRLTGVGDLRLSAPGLDAPVTLSDEPPLPFGAGRQRRGGPPQGPLRQSRGEFEDLYPDEPRLPDVDRPAPLDRVYAEGPNAGPRREGEAHGRPRRGIRYVDTPTGPKRTAYDSALTAEDPATYPPEVRRELAQMVYELETYLPDTVQGGSTPGQLSALTEELGDIASAVGYARSSGTTAGFTVAGAPVRRDILHAAQGNFAHVTKAEMVQMIKAALLEGRGNGLTDAAAQVARKRLATIGLSREELAQTRFMDRLEGASGNTARIPYQRIAPEGAGDELIGWVDADGNLPTPDHALTEYQRAARGASVEEIRQVQRSVDEAGGVDSFPEPEVFQAYLDEGVRRGLIPLKQGDLSMEGPGGAGGARLQDFEGGPPPNPLRAISRQKIEQDAAIRGTQADIPNTPEGRALERARLEADGKPIPEWLKEKDVPLPGLEQVRETEIPTPEPDVPFSLTPPPPPKKLPPTGGTGNLFAVAGPAASLAIPDDPDADWDNYLRAGLLAAGGVGLGMAATRQFAKGKVVILNVLKGDRKNLQRWLTAHEPVHGGEAWYSRVEQHIADGDWDKAWKAAQAASAKSFTAAQLAAKTTQQQQLLQQAVKGTPLQADVNTDIIAGQRTRTGGLEATAKGDFPPSLKVSQAGAARGKATLGPAGIVNPGPPQRPLSSTAPALRAGILDTKVVRMLMAETSAEGMATVPGNRDTNLRLFRQVGEAVYRGKNLKLLREAGVKISPEELSAHFNATISEYGRGLQMLQQFSLQNKEILEAAAEQLSMGGALRGMLGGSSGPPPLITGARNRPIGRLGKIDPANTLDMIAKDTQTYEAVMLANTLQKRRPVGPLRAIHDASYAFMLSKWNTAVRNYVSYTGRYSVDSLVHATTIPIAKLLGDESTAALSTALLKERGLQPMGRAGTAVNPVKGGWADTLQEIYNFTADNLDGLKPNDARRAIRLLLDVPEQAAQYMGTITGEDLSESFSNTPVLRHLINPKVQRFITMFNRAQEFSARATVFDATMRALVRAKGLDPTSTLLKSTDEIAQAVGGRVAFEDMLQTSTMQALEATFAGRTSKDSLPGALIRFLNSAWPLKLGVPFPRFNFSAAPRWIYDHSPAALLDLARFPLDAGGITAPKGTMAGGRLYRGMRAQSIEQKALPELSLKMGQAERKQGEALAGLLSTQREYSIRQRQVARLERRAQKNLPGIDTLESARASLEQLGRRREQLKTTVQTAGESLKDLKAQQKDLLDVLADARGINAPNFSQYLARVGVGTVGILGAAWVIRAQPGAEGTRWYEFKVDRGEGQDPIILDFRPFAPFAQSLFVADVLHDFYKHTNWDGYREQVGEESIAGPLDRLNAIWDNYEGKYTSAELGAQFAQAFLSISRAAGTTLTLTDLLTQNGWPSLQDAADSIIGTMGQFLSRGTVPGQMVTDVIGEFDPEEAKTRIPPRATLEEPMRPLAAPIANIPFARRVIPERISQTSGKAVAAEYPLLRALAGVGSAPRDFIVEEVRRIGLPGQSVFIRETGDAGLDRLVAETYAKILGETLPQILEDPSYTGLGTPARQRDFMQRYVFPDLKRAALGTVRGLLGEERFTAATVRGEEARRRRRVDAMLEELGPETPEPQEEAPADPLSPPSAEAPPPPPF